jgi:hypothetical protein
MNTTVSTFLAALRIALQARAGLAGVTVSTGPLGDGVGGQESIEFGHVDNTIDWHAIGRKAREENYMVDGWIFVTVYGGDEAAISAARDRAVALLDEVNTCLVADPSVGGVVTVAQVTAWALDQAITGQNTNARGAAIEFTTSVKAIIRG